MDIIVSFCAYEIELLVIQVIHSIITYECIWFFCCCIIILYEIASYLVVLLWFTLSIAVNTCILHMSKIDGFSFISNFNRKSQYSFELKTFIHIYCFTFEQCLFFFVCLLMHILSGKTICVLELNSYTKIRLKSEFLSMHLIENNVNGHSVIVIAHVLIFNSYEILSNQNCFFLFDIFFSYRANQDSSRNKRIFSFADFRNK